MTIFHSHIYEIADKKTAYNEVCLYSETRLKRTTRDRQNPFVITVIRYNRVNLCSKWTIGTEIFVRYNRVFVKTVFVITEFYCSIFGFFDYQKFDFTAFNILSAKF